ncbi:hypothetical protein H7J86_21005 [Mycobacterium hackensackense]|nr:hypothetical protein [Mycobacterium hackensackense]
MARVPAEEAVSATSMLGLVDSDSQSSIEYAIGGAELTDENRERLAQLLAEDAMRIRCGNSPAFESWRTRRDGGPSAIGSKKSALEAYVGIGFKLPGTTPNENHVQGHVAELIWNRLMEERLVCRDGRRLLRAHSVKPDPLEPGGDGLVIYSRNMPPEEDLVFRLWEIKKHDAAGKVSATIRRASKQLRNRGHEYLAKLAGCETVAKEGALGDLYANIVELWFDRSDRSGVGVSVGTSSEKAPSDQASFKSLLKQFPEYSDPGQREAIVVAIPDFPSFADRVKEIVWSGL